MFQITFPFRDGRIQDPEVQGICFGCGQISTREITVYFEDAKFGLIARVKELNQRTQLIVPVCEDCANAKSTYRKKTAIWALVSLAAIAVGMAILLAVGLEDDKTWPIFVMIGLAIFPVRKMAYYWQLKDRGGALVTPVEVRDGTITLAFQSRSAFEALK